MDENLSGELIDWPDPWERLEPSMATTLETELQRELHRDHQLYGRKVSAIARRLDCDDVLFLLHDGDSEVAEVHLTWRVENSPEWPYTTIFHRLDDWLKHYQ